MNKIQIIALFGESASGKDTIQKWVTANYENVNSIISCTTRPKRDYEKNQIDYYFTREDGNPFNINGKINCTLEINE